MAKRTVRPSAAISARSSSALLKKLSNKAGGWVRESGPSWVQYKPGQPLEERYMKAAQSAVKAAQAAVTALAKARAKAGR